MKCRSVSIERGGHRYVFRYPLGSEDDILDAIVGKAQDPTCPLDWVDAAGLSFQVTQKAAAACSNALTPWGHEAA